jgi:hypothetical protein
VRISAFDACGLKTLAGNSGLPFWGDGIKLAVGTAWEVVLRTECSKMTLSISDQSYVVSNGVTYLPSSSAKRLDGNIRLNDRWARRTDGLRVEIKKRISTLRRLIADCDRMASDLDQEVENEENRVRVRDPADIAYSIYAKATASRRDNLTRSANELRAHLAKAERQLCELGEAFPL